MSDGVYNSRDELQPKGGMERRPRGGRALGQGAANDQGLIGLWALGSCCWLLWSCYSFISSVWELPLASIRVSDIVYGLLLRGSVPPLAALLLGIAVTLSPDGERRG